MFIGWSSYFLRILQENLIKKINFFFSKGDVLLWRTVSALWLEIGPQVHRMQRLSALQCIQKAKSQAEDLHRLWYSKVPTRRISFKVNPLNPKFVFQTYLIWTFFSFRLLLRLYLYTYYNPTKLTEEHRTYHGRVRTVDKLMEHGPDVKEVGLHFKLK